MAKQKRKSHHGILHDLTATQPAKGHVTNTLVETGKDLLIGVIGGGVVGALVGRPSLILGLGIAATGHYTENRLAQVFGVGMMAANGYQKSGNVSGLEGLDGMKERLQAYKESFGDKFYLSKFLKKKSLSAATAGFGEVQLFNYNEMNGGLAALDDIEKQLADSALEFHGAMAGQLPEMGEPDMMGDTEIMGDVEIMGNTEIMGDISDRLY